MLSRFITLVVCFTALPALQGCAQNSSSETEVEQNAKNTAGAAREDILANRISALRVRVSNAEEVDAMATKDLKLTEDKLSATNEKLKAAEGIVVAITLEKDEIQTAMEGKLSTTNEKVKTAERIVDTITLTKDELQTANAMLEKSLADKELSLKAKINELNLLTSTKADTEDRENLAVANLAETEAKLSESISELAQMKLSAQSIRVTRSLNESVSLGVRPGTVGDEAFRNFDPNMDDATVQLLMDKFREKPDGDKGGLLWQITSPNGEFISYVVGELHDTPVDYSLAPLERIITDARPLAVFGECTTRFTGSWTHDGMVARLKKNADNPDNSSISKFVEYVAVRERKRLGELDLHNDEGERVGWSSNKGNPDTERRNLPMDDPFFALIKRSFAAQDASGCQLSRVLVFYEQELCVLRRTEKWIELHLVPEMLKGRVLAAFGFAHLLGPKGVIEQLIHLGFTAAPMVM